MKRTVFGIATLLLLSTAPCVANAFTAIAWSQSGQKGGSVKNAPTKEAAISAAIADCKKSGGGADCQVFKVTDEPGFVALYATCAKTCGVTAVTGRPTAEQARIDGKRECEAYYRASCQLAQEWQEGQPRQLPASSQEATTQCFVQDHPCACVTTNPTAKLDKIVSGEMSYEKYMEQLSGIEIICMYTVGQKTSNQEMSREAAHAMLNRQDAAREAVKYGFLNLEQYELAAKQNGWSTNKAAAVTPEQGRHQNAGVVTNQRACDSGDGAGCYNLGVMYYKGEGVSQDKLRAGMYYAQGCDLREGSSCTNLGMMYSKGEGVSQDKEEAVRSYDKGCGLGDGKGCYNLGNIYRKGNDARQDKQKAFQYYDKACSLKVGAGCYAVGLMYDDGSGGRQDKQKAAYFLKKACELNVDAACGN